MATRRLSRGTPVLAATVEQQEAWVKAIDADPDAVAAIEALTGKAWSAMSFGERLIAYGQKITQGEALAGLVAAEKTKRDLLDLAADHKGEISARDRVTLLEQENTGLREENERMRRGIDRLNRKIIELTAEPAMAVNSGERRRVSNAG